MSTGASKPPSAQALAATLLGLLGIWLALRELPYFIHLLVILIQEPDLELGENVLGLHFSRALINLLFGAALLATRERLATLVTSGSTESPALVITIATGTALVGVYFVADGLVGLSQYFWGGLRHSTSSIDHFIEPMASTLIGAGFFLGSNNIAKVWNKLG